MAIDCFHESLTHCAVYPPSTANNTPVIHFASALAKKTAGPAISSASPNPPNGCIAPKISVWSPMYFEALASTAVFVPANLLQKHQVTVCVRIREATHLQDKLHCSGSYALRSPRQPVSSFGLPHPLKRSKTLDPRPISWNTAKCMIRFHDSRVFGKPTKLLADAMLMIQPRSPSGCGCCFNICMIAYFEPRKTERALTPTTRSHSSSDISCIQEAGGTTPALLTIL